MDTVNKGIPCFEYNEIGPKGQMKIDFRFVSGDGETASSCTVALGDPDPMTGERITDVTFFREYHLLRNREIYYNKKAVAAPWTSREKETRNALRERIASDFEAEHGYAPDKGTLDWLLGEQMPKRYCLQMDSLVNEEGESCVESMMAFSDPSAENAYREVEEEGHTLDDFERTLTPIQQDVFRMLRMKSEGICVHGMGLKLAEKWGVHKSDISKTKLAIGKKLRKWLAE